MRTEIYSISNLDCANCAAKAEAKIRAVPGVAGASIVFATMQLHLTAEDPDALLPEVLAAARQVEPDIAFGEGAEHTHHDCSCGHCHDHDHAHHHDHDHEHPHQPQNRELWMLLLGGGLFLVGLFLQSMPLLCVPVFLAAYLILGWDVLAKAGKNLIRGHVLDENFLMSLATIGAFAISEFPEAVGIILFYRVGEFFEEKAVSHSRAQIMAAIDLRPEVVRLTSGETIPAEEAKPGDLLLIRPGDRIPLDGTVVSGESRIDTAPITGEPVPVRVQPGSNLISGCVNTSGQLTMRVEKPLSESMVTRILHSVENAAAGKPRLDRFITRFARVYTPVVVGLSAAVAVIPSLITGNWNYWIYTALSFLVMSCPCALVLSVPLTFFSGIGTASRKGILFKSGAAIEALAEVKAIVMDKTGTLTRGDFAVQAIEGDEDVLALCAACEQYSSHPIAASILACAAERGIPLMEPESVEELSGKGIRARLQGKQILCGNEILLTEHGIPFPPFFPAGSQVLVSVDGIYAGRIQISDTLKPGAAEAIAQIHAQNITTAMLTGDRRAAADIIALDLGIQRVWANLLPDEKLEKMRALRAEIGPTMFVGDGINDAPVLSGADVGAAMGSGADAALEAADVVFLTGQVSAIPDAVTIAKNTRRVARQNIVFALTVKLVVMALGLLGYASMWAAVFADSGVAMLCVLNAIRMLYRRKNPNAGKY